jgi:hypothetical protein
MTSEEIQEKLGEKFTRLQILSALEDVPLNYRTSEEHLFAEQLIDHCMDHFRKLSVEYTPSYD